MMTAWEWVKKYWQFLVGLLVALLAALFYVEVTSKPKVVLAGNNPVKEAAEKEAAEQVKKAEQLAEDQKRDVAKEHAAAIEKHLEDAKTKTEEVRTNVDKTNEFLQGVGKDIRGDS